MAKIELKFLDFIDESNYLKVENSYYYDSCIEVNEPCIKVTLGFEGEETIVDMNKSTAIKFAKTLRTEINKIKE